MQLVILKEQINEPVNIQCERSQGQILARYWGCFTHIGLMSGWVFFFFCGTGIFKIRLSFWAKANLVWAAQLTRTLNMRLKSFDNPDDEINEFSTAQLSKLLVSCTLTPRGNRYDPWLCSQAAEKPLLLDLYFTHSKLYRQTLIKTSVWVCACSHTWLARRRESYDERTTWSECDNRRF